MKTNRFAKNFKIALVGDVMCGDSFYAIGKGVASSIDRYGKTFMPPETAGYLKSHHAVLANIEAPLSDIGRNDLKLRTLHMRGRARFARHLGNWGISIANLANNHILEHGREAAVDCQMNLKNAGLITVGSGKNKDFTDGFDIETLPGTGRKIHILGLCLRREKYAFNGGGNTDQAIECVKKLTRAGKTVIVALHWGDELMDRPDLWQRKTAREFIDAGASVIAGHHPHVVQGFEMYKDRLIAYSLGNFVFDDFLPDCRWSMILSATLRNNIVIDLDYVPIEKDSCHRPHIQRNSRGKILKNEIKRRCDLLRPVQDDEVFSNSYRYDFIKKDSLARGMLKDHLRQNFREINPLYWPQIILRPIQRRLRIW